MTPPIVLTVAAHDPLGGAGLAADLTTFAALGVHGMAVVTAVTAQRFDAVDRVAPVAADMLAAQLDGIISQVRPDAMKVGLLFAAEQVRVISDRIEQGDLPAPVVDPVMVNGRGDRFVSDEVEAACRSRLFPLAAVLTPNRAEADLLGPDDAALAELGAPLVVVTGGEAATDPVITAAGRVDELIGAKIATANVRGSGCTFAAAVAAEIGRGTAPREALSAAKGFVTARLRAGADWRIAPGEAAGPVAHVIT